MIGEYDKYREFDEGYYPVGNKREKTTDGDLYEALVDGDTDREVDFDTLIDVMLDLSPHCSYEQRWKVLENFGWLLKHNTVSLTGNDELLRDNEQLTTNLIAIHEGRIKDDYSIKEYFSALRKLFKK